MAEWHTWQRPVRDVIHIFCDAAGDPARVAAIAWDKGDVWYVDCQPPTSITGRWCARRDQQIMGLELLSFALALPTFEKLCRGRRVVLYGDNRGAECCFRSGTAKHKDHSQIVHAMWTHAAVCHMHLRIERVGTRDNWADLPSRSAYDTLKYVGAVECQPVFAKVYGLGDAGELVSRMLCP